MTVATSEVVLRNGDEVFVDSMGGTRAVIDTIRRISSAEVVDTYQGCPTDVVLSVQIGDSFLNLRGSQVTLPGKPF